MTLSKLFAAPEAATHFCFMAPSPLSFEPSSFLALVASWLVGLGLFEIPLCLFAGVPLTSSVEGAGTFVPLPRACSGGGCVAEADYDALVSNSFSDHSSS